MHIGEIRIGSDRSAGKVDFCRFLQNRYRCLNSNTPYRVDVSLTLYAAAPGSAQESEGLSRWSRYHRDASLTSQSPCYYYECTCKADVHTVLRFRDQRAYRRRATLTGSPSLRIGTGRVSGSAGSLGSRAICRLCRVAFPLRRSANVDLASSECT